MKVLLFLGIYIAEAVSANFDNYIFSRSWIPGFCYFNRQGFCQNSSLRQKFTCHGLWPTYTNGSWPQYCSHEVLDNSSLKEIKVDLNNHWSDDGNENWKLWSHEWSKHGTCALHNYFINNSLDYFSTTLWLDMRLNLNGLLENSSIIPANNVNYLTSRVEELLLGRAVCQKKGGKNCRYLGSTVHF